MAMNLTIEDKKKLMDNTVEDVLNGSIYSMPELAAEAAKVRDAVRCQSWTGEWFCDNALRQQDGSLKLVDQSTADCILYCTVKEASFADVTTDNYNSKIIYKPKEWAAKVNVEYNLIIPGQAKPLKQGTVTGNSRFQAPIDEEVSRLRAVRQACYDASRSILYAIVEGW